MDKDTMDMGADTDGTANTPTKVDMGMVMGDYMEMGKEICLGMVMAVDMDMVMDLCCRP